MVSPNTFKHGYPFNKYAMMPCISSESDPTTSDLYHPTAGGFYPLPTLWSNSTNNKAYILTSITSGTTANWQGITDAATGNVVGPSPAVSTANALARWDGTGGRTLKNSTVTMDDTTGTMTYPAGGGIVLTAGGAAARKGSATLVAGTVTVNTTSAITGAAIVPVVTALGTVATVQGLRVSISNGVSFTVTSNDNTDTSTFTWAIVG